MEIALDQIKIDEALLTVSEDESIRIDELADSIKEHGMNHPIIVRPLNIPEGGYSIVSGFRRYLAHRRIPGLQSIKAEVKDVSELQGRILRLHENVNRKNLPWFEQAELVAELHRSRQEEHGAKSEEGAGRPKKSDGPVWGIRDTAAELGRALGGVAEDIQLARAVSKDPSLRNVSDRKTAVRLVRNAADRARSETEALAPKGDSIYDQVFFGDSEAILKQLPDKCVDAVITDPPWLKFYDPKLRLDKRTLPVFKEIYRVLKSNTFLLVFCGSDDFVYYAGFDSPDPAGNIIRTKGELEKIGFQVSKTPSIWKKGNALSRRGVRTWEYDRDFEFVIVAAKGNPTMSSSTAPSSFKLFDAVPVRSLIHPNEKPEGLIASYLDDISYEGNIILDPFAGSFVTGTACKARKRHYILVERDRETYVKGCGRLGVKP